MPLRFLCYSDEIKTHLNVFFLRCRFAGNNADNITQNVFDGTKDLCGLQLQGIEKQASVGFLSYLECLRYLEVIIWPNILNFKTSGGQPFEMPLLASLGARKWNAPNSPVFPAGDFSWCLNILIACNYTNYLEKKLPLLVLQLSLVAPPSPREAAVSAFTALDTDQSGFIPGTRCLVVK